MTETETTTTAIDTSKDYSLKETATLVNRSDQWLRKQMAKRMDTLIGKGAFKNDDGHWRVPGTIVALYAEDRETKDANAALRATGQLPKNVQAYVPEGVRAPRYVRAAIRKDTYSLTPEQIATFTDVCNKIEMDQMEYWQERQTKRAEANGNAVADDAVAE